MEQLTSIYTAEYVPKTRFYRKRCDSIAIRVSYAFIESLQAAPSLFNHTLLEADSEGTRTNVPKKRSEVLDPFDAPWRRHEAVRAWEIFLPMFRLARV